MIPDRGPPQVADEQADALLLQLQSEKAEYRSRAARVLGNMGGERVVAALIEALADTDPDVFGAVKESLLLLRPKSTSEIVKALIHPEPLVRAGAVELVGEMHHVEALARVHELTQDPDREVRIAAVNALVKLEGQKAHDWLAPLLDDIDGQVRATVVRALGVIHDAASAGLVTPKLKDYDPAVRLATLETLARIGGQESVDQLLDLEHDPDEKVAAAAQEALAAIGERAVGPYIEDLTKR
ncbi:MAG: HEAT repeat domain-containing protein, partial [candidate division WOR-3 bacterium]